MEVLASSIITTSLGPDVADTYHGLVRGSKSSWKPIKLRFHSCAGNTRCTPTLEPKYCHLKGTEGNKVILYRSTYSCDTEVIT